MKQGLMAAIIGILAVGTLALAACDLQNSPLSCENKPESQQSESQSRQPEFLLSSLTITPNNVMVNEEVIVSLDVANISSEQNTYQGILTINGVEWGRKLITVAEGDTEKLTFTLHPGAGGRFDISVGGLHALLIVKEEVELGYDDGRPDNLPGTGIIILGAGSGYLIKFSPPVTPFTINRVKIYGSLYGEISAVQTFQVEIWDENMDIIYPSTYPYTAFSQTPAWVQLNVDDVEVDGDFYIHVCTSSTENSGIQVFFDSSVDNTHSDVTKEWEISDEWYPQVPKEEVNWMIRVDGTIIGTTGGEGGQ